MSNGEDEEGNVAQQRATGSTLLPPWMLGQINE